MTPSCSRFPQSWCWKCLLGTPSKKNWQGEGGGGGFTQCPSLALPKPLTLPLAQTEAERGSWFLAYSGFPQAESPP